MNVELHIQTTLKEAIIMLRTVLGVEPAAAGVLHWMCTKERDGLVRVDPFDYQQELSMTRQQFSNNVASLRKAGLVSGERGLYTISEVVPRKVPFTLTVKFT